MTAGYGMLDQSMSFSPPVQGLNLHDEPSFQHSIAWEVKFLFILFISGYLKKQ